jgi:hydroxymethylpyrimidine pyrophosphatase-like HAD family hydrolase
MPDNKILSKKYLDKSIIPQMEKICEGEPTDFVIYAGFEWNNICFFRKNHFNDQLTQYLEARRIAFHEEWSDIVSFENLPIEEFPSIKCFGELKPAQHLADKIEKKLGLHVPVIKDPFCNEFYVVQATHPEVSKGQAIRDFVRMTEYRGIIIAAGDDLNDLSMFEEAHVKVAMEDAPIELKLKADIIAPPAATAGIIEGLKKAIVIKNE